MTEYIPLLQTTLWVGLILVGVILFRETLVDRINKGGSLEVGSVFKLGQVSQKIESVQQQVDGLYDRVGKLFLLTMAPAMYSNLKKLSTGNFGPYTKSSGLERELYHLRDIGYVNILSITDLPDRDENLSAYVTVTTTGQLFVQLREEIETRANVSVLRRQSMGNR